MGASSFRRPRDCTIPELLARLVAAFPDAEALAWPSRAHRRTFAQLDQESLEAARAFAAAGVGRGDRVTLWAENSPEWIVVQLALARLGAVLVTANTALKPPEIEYLLRQSRSCGVVRDAGGDANPRAAALAQGAGREMSSHLFPEVSCHLLAATPTCHWLEYVDWANPVLKDPVAVKDGHVIIPDVPGTGIAWDEQAVERYKV